MWMSHLKTLRLYQYRRSIFFAAALSILILPAILPSFDLQHLNAASLLRASAILAIFIAVVWNDADRCEKEDQLKKRLQTLERRVEGLIQNTTDAVITFDEEHLVDRWNPQAEKLFHLSHQDAHGQDLFELLFPPPDKNTTGWHETLSHHIKTYHPDQGSRRLATAEKLTIPHKDDDRELRLEYTLIATPEEDHQIRFVLILRDLSEQEELQLRMIQMDRLAAVGTLAAGVVHEINNPLTYIASAVEFVKECLHNLSPSKNNSATPLPKHTRDLLEELQSWTNTIDEGAQRIRKIVRDMQIYFHPHPSTEEQTFSIKEVLDLAVRMTRGEIQKRAQVEVELKTKAQICSDQTRISQVFVNLIVNAMHAMEHVQDRQHRLKICAYDKNDRVIITFSDTGKGMSKKVQRQIFSPFFTTKPMGSGTGLGLSLSRAIIEESGGKIAVDSTPGQGSTFRVELPITKQINSPGREE